MGTELALARGHVDGDAARVSVASSHPDGLTEREVDVLRLIAGGGTSREIAAALSLSIRTVERHTVNIYYKINTRNRADATAYALRHGLLT